MILKRIGLWWRQRQRNIDMKILWPVCVQQAPTRPQAQAAFAVHAFNDPAWTKDYTHDQLKLFIDALESNEPWIKKREPVS